MRQPLPFTLCDTRRSNIATSQRTQHNATLPLSRISRPNRHQVKQKPPRCREEGLVTTESAAPYLYLYRDRLFYRSGRTSFLLRFVCPRSESSHPCPLPQDQRPHPHHGTISRISAPAPLFGATGPPPELIGTLRLPHPCPISEENPVPPRTCTFLFCSEARI